MNIRIGNGYDVHAFKEGRKLFLGGVEIAHKKGLNGHSDADVLLHAICDALLGALALGDIGKHFPDNDESLKDVDSKLLLENVYKLIKKHRYKIINIDSIIVAQKPKLQEYILLMRETIANIVNIEVSQISIKATTTEHLGFAGREEGIESYAVALLERM